MTIIRNDDNLKDNDINEFVRRVKILIVDSQNKMMLGYSYHEYQFIGGHVEEGEDLPEAVEREIEEETGIKIDAKKERPFACNISYYKDYPNKGINQKIEIYYYEIRTDLKPNLKNTNYTIEESEGNFELRYIPFDKLEEELENNAREYGDPNGITKEMLGLLKIWR